MPLLKFRLLIACVIVAPLVARAQTVSTVTADGAWTWFNDPRAIYDNGKIYTGWMDSGGYVWFGLHDVASHSTSAGKLYNGNFFQSDDHDNPAFILTSPTTIQSFYSPHGGAAVRTQPITLTGSNSFSLGAPLNLTRSGDVTGSNGWTYANPFRLSAENKTYVFSRGPNFNPVMRIHDDSQSYNTITSWSTATTFISNPGQRPYVKYDSNNTNRVGIAFTDGHPRNVQNNIYYAYVQNGAYYRADGTKIKDVTDGPIVLSDMTGSGTVFNHLNSNSGVTGTNSWIWDVATDGGGHPVLTYATFPSSTHHQYHWARWDGAQWIDRTLVADAGPYIGSPDEGNYSGGIVLDHTDPNIVYLSANFGGMWNLLQYKTENDGASWTSRLIAAGTGAADENVRPYVPLNRPADTEMVMWMRGQYDYWNFSQGVGYDTAMMVWTNPVPEPGSLGVIVLSLLLIRRGRRGVDAPCPHQGRGQ
ncbi:MAG TPA: BNR-4 repeat-containing protein [Tepidisphaeraceae bacterium]|jgi:hypothetical protein